jgi:hypothetical protein
VHTFANPYLSLGIVTGRQFLLPQECRSTPRMGWMADTDKVLDSTNGEKSFSQFRKSYTPDDRDFFLEQI